MDTLWTEDEVALALRARAVGLVPEGLLYGDDTESGGVRFRWHARHGWLPVFDDAALDRLTEILRLVWSDPHAHLEPQIGMVGWWRCAYGPKLSRAFPSKAEALIFAIEDTRDRM